MQFAGHFETHLTVAARSTADAARLSVWACGRGLKFTHIVLDRGLTPSQPMVTGHARGRLAGQIVEAREIAAALAGEGLAASRIKIEVAPDNADVPQSDKQAASQPADRYFEHHLKLLLPREADIDRISTIASPAGGHVSRNALKRRGDGRQERFVTQRCYGVGRDRAEAQFSRLFHTLRSGGVEIVDAEREYVVYDDNLAADAGWM